MSHCAGSFAWSLTLALACASPAPPPSSTPEVGGTPPATSHDADTDESSVPEPALAPSSPAASDTPSAAPSDPSAPRIETLFVHESLAACELEGARQCLQVRSAEDEPWRNFFGAIQGFEPEPSHRYELRVEVTPRPNPPPGASRFRYRLVEVVSKRKLGM